VGTQKRQNSYPNQTRQFISRRESNANPGRDTDTGSRQIYVYAHKGDYYPIVPILPNRIDDGSRSQPSSSRRDSYSIQRSASAIEKSRQDEPRRHSTRRLPPAPSRLQSQPQQALST
jgi:hypothetical protein